MCGNRPYLKPTFILLAVCWLTACQTAPQISQLRGQLFYDEAFADASSITIETQQQVFALDQDGKDYVRDTIGRIDDPIEKMEVLAHSIFNRLDFNLLYQGDANTIASETFRNRAANCLSLSIMTYALAREAGFSVRFQDIDIPEFWTRRGGISLLNGHINLKIVPRSTNNAVYFTTQGYQVDFDPQAIKAHLPKKYISKQLVLAMFYNNKGADALLQHDFDSAYAYFTTALKLEPQFSSGWVNLGFLYRLKGLYTGAERVYSHALNMAPDNLTGWENLAYLYTYTGRADEADVILARVERKRQDNPFYHLDLGEREFDKGNWRIALDHFRRALALNNKHAEIFFSLAKTYYQLGEVERTQHYLKRAKRTAQSLNEKDKYQGKMDLLSRS
ncbi:MAG: tetratricopeptide (TPR) repeat protein [Paraglaciecola sp.]|jgi:tetratricopeptide (TPR) repeat protein